MNEITRFVEIRWKDGDGKYKKMEDRDENTLWSRINKLKPMKMADMKTVLSPTKVGILMNKLGLKKVRKDNRRGYLVHRYYVDEISSNRKVKIVDGEEQVLPF